MEKKKETYNKIKNKINNTYHMHRNVSTIPYKLNYIRYIMNIINNEEMTDEEKAKKLWDYITYNELVKRYNLIIKKYNFNKEQESLILNRLNYILSIYEDYIKKGYINNSINNQIQQRLLNLKTIAAILDSEDSNHNKAEKFLYLFRNYNDFRQKYTYFIKEGENDEKLDIAREELNNFDKYLNKIKELEEKGIIDDVRHYIRISKYLNTYKYAKYIITNYINDKNSYKKRKFLAYYGIDENILNFCIKTIEELDIDLYNQYLEKFEKNKELRIISNTKTITMLANAIKTGLQTDGTPFDLLEFIKKVPFIREPAFCIKIIDFMKKNNPEDLDIISNYIWKNKLHKSGALEPINIKEFNIETTINGIEFTLDDINIIIEYMKANNIPLINKAFVLVKKKYLNGEITAEMINSQKNKSYVKTLIPCA